ncbi:MAG TPA: hypothetical protein VFN55_14235 [Solirubrobacteraceae bacterium]|nr:hypothetical protein [Solirubrobacteraceae bacterium]
MRHAIVLLAVGAALTAAVLVVPAPAPARALTIPSPVCTIAGLFSGLAGTACRGLRAGGELLSKGKGLVSAGSNVTRAAGVAFVLAGIVGWVTKGSRAALQLTARAVGWSTRPQLQSSWFSASYWRMAAIAMLLTVPFLMAACVQAVLRSDMAMLGQAVLGYLPLAVLAIMVAAPVTALLLAASDELCTLISGAAGSAPGAALSKLVIGSSSAAMLSGSSFVALVVGLITVAAGMTLWIELLIRSAAVYVIVLMLPVLFAALVWPARRVWAGRGVEVLVALILAKFAIVAVLSLGASAIGQGVLGGIRVVAGATLVLLAAFSPWAVLRLVPLHELAAGAAAWTPHLRHPVGSALGPAADRAEGDTESAQGAPAVSPRGAWDTAHAIMTGLGLGGGAEAEVLAAQVSGRGDPTAPASDGRDQELAGPKATGSDESGAGSGTSAPAAASGSSAAIAAQNGSAIEDIGTTEGGSAPPSPSPGDDPVSGERPTPAHEFDKPSIIFGDDFAFGRPEPGGVAPRPIEDDPAATPEPEPERDEPPMPPDDEHGTGPL